jgi:spore coat polysaccharide biosynthesis protein SpsF
MKRRLVAAIACRNQGSRLYGKPMQNLDVKKGIRILDHIIECIGTIECIDEIVLGISEGVENEVFKYVALEKGIQYITGDEEDVLSRLISCGELTGATDIFRVTSESPFLYYEPVEALWNRYQEENLDAIFMDEIVDGCGFEIISLEVLRKSHFNGDKRHRSEFCSLYIRENIEMFKVVKIQPTQNLIRKDLRLTVDNPEDLAVCRTLYNVFQADAPRFSIEKLIQYLDKNPKLKELVEPFTEIGYSTMNL